jgi:DDE family transposase
VAAKPPERRERLRERDLCRWKLIEDFQAAVAKAAQDYPLHPTFSDPERLMTYSHYLSLFLFGLLNPVVRTMRGLCGASQLPRVQAQICQRPVSLGSFSAAQHVLDPELLEKVFVDLSEPLRARQPGDPRLQTRKWMAHDGTMWSALPRMAWALYGGGPKGDSRGVKLHLSFHLLEDKPAKATVRPGKDCERAVWQEHWQEGDAFVGDRYFGEDHRLLAKLQIEHCAYVLRLREQSTINVEEELEVSDADRKAGVVRQAWARLGASDRTRSVRVRVVWVEADGHSLILVTNLSLEELPGEVVSLLYRKRWQVELFFRWIKCILGCRHWLAESPAGVTIQIYLALIAAVLLQLYTGQRPTRRMMELIQFYLLGVATLEDLTAGLQREFKRLAAKSKNPA